MYPRKYQDNDCSQFLFVLLLQYIEPLSDGGGLYLVLCTVLCINVCFVEHAFVLNASFFVRQTKQLFQLFCARFQTYFDAVVLFVMCLLRINCLLQRCVHLFAQPIFDCYLDLWNMRMLSMTAIAQKTMLTYCCGTKSVL